MAMNFSLGYINVNLEELTLVNYFQDYLWYKCDQDLVQSTGRNKEGKELEFSFSLPSVYRLG